MRISPRIGKWLAIGTALTLLLSLLVIFWIVPALIVSQIRGRYQGQVRIGGWWINASSAGVTGLSLHEGDDGDSPVWASVAQVSTDLSFWTLLRGRFSPSKFTFESPHITIRIAPDGNLSTRIPLKPGDGPEPLPELTVDRGRLTFRQEGRPEMVVQGIEAKLTPDPEHPALTARADDPSWGKIRLEGSFGPKLDSLELQLHTEGLVADAEKARRLPFVPGETWSHVVPKGPVSIHLRLSTAARPANAPDLLAVVAYENTALELPTLGLETVETTGRMIVEGGLVRLENLKGRAIGGMVIANGALDFANDPARIDLNLDLDAVDVARSPRSWQLADAGLTGRLTGRAHLNVTLEKNGADLSGTSGDGILTGGTIGGIPFKSLKLNMKAEGTSLEYQTGSTPETTSWLASWMTWNLVALRIPSRGRESSPAQDRPATPAESSINESGSPPKNRPADSQEQPSGGLILPKTLSTEVEFEDVDLTKVLARGEAVGIHLPFVLAGKLSLKASATIPLRSLRDLKAYVFHGQLTLVEAHLDGIDLGRLTATLDLEDGLLELSHLKGQLVDLPDGGLKKRSEPTADFPDDGPLPEGGFRGRLRARLSPPGPLDASIEGHQLPLGELAAPALPRPTPLSGIIDINAQAKADMSRLSDLSAWTVNARIESQAIAYENARLDAVETRLTLEDSRLDMERLSATLAGQPLRAHASLRLSAPFPFEGDCEITGWRLGNLVAFAPEIHKLATLDGTVDLKAEARGSLRPWSLTSRGEATIDQGQYNSIAVGSATARWETLPDSIGIQVAQAQVFGGTLTAVANVPSREGNPITGSAQFHNLKIEKIKDVFAIETLALSGEANGKANVRIEPGSRDGTDPVVGDLVLDATNLVWQGIPVSEFEAVASAAGSRLQYDLYAEGLGGKFRLKGDCALAARLVDLKAGGNLQAIGFELTPELWQALGVSGALAEIRGQGAIDANYLATGWPLDFRTRGVAEFRGLRWGSDIPLGQLRGQFGFSREGWTVDRLTGELLGGQVEGALVAEDTTTQRINLEIKRAALSRVLSLLPGFALSTGSEGNASLRVSGRFGEAFRATGEVRLDRGRVGGIPVSDLLAPLDLAYIPAARNGTLRIARYSTRLSGGRVQGSARIRFGQDRAFQTEAHLTDLDLETVSRLYTDSHRPASGKVSGVLQLAGADQLRPATYHGRADLILRDAAVVDLPVFRALDRFLGGRAGGIFDEGEIRAAIANRSIEVETLSLLGRIAQLHATGTVGFDTQLDLIALINTNQIIPQTGQALLSVIPGLNLAQSAREEVALRVANYLSTRLIKLRVGGTIRNPSIRLDPTVTVSNAAVGFFGAALKLPLGLFK